MEYNEQLKRFETSFKVDIYDYNFTTFITTLTNHMNIVIGAADALPYVSGTDITGNTEYFKARSLNRNNLIGTCILTPGQHSGYDEVIRYLEAYRIYDLPAEYPANSIGFRYTDILTGKYADVLGSQTRLYDENGQAVATISGNILPYGYSYGGSSTVASCYFWFLMCTVSNGSIANMYNYFVRQSPTNNHVYAGFTTANAATRSWFMSLGGVAPEHTDPYAPGGNTGPGGGGGTGPEGIINDDIDFPTPLTISAANANFISIWTPTLDQVQTLAKWMWTTDPLKWEFWQKLLQNPLDLIFSLTIMPIPIHHPDEGGSATEGELVAYTDSLSLGWQDTGIRMDWVNEQYVTIDMGTINLEEVWGAFLDYEPYTKIDIFLPYIGTKQLDTNDCMPRSISLRYVIDLATGTCVALIKCDNSVYYHFSGNCASQIPITVNQCQEIVRGLMTMAVGAATFALGGPMGAGAHASKVAIAKGATMKAGGAAMVGSGADSAAKGVNVSRSGVIGAAAGLMDVQTPYLIISRPRQAVPEEQNKYTGYPSFITEQIGDLSGYTEVQMIHLHNMSCTDEEYKEIDSLLTQGVII